MPKIKLFIATTLDGFIAREDGSLDWLTGMPNPGQTDHGYNEFIQSIDTIVMGRKTYQEVLGFGVPWPYADCMTYVATTNSRFETSTPSTGIIRAINSETIQQLRLGSSKNIWLVGGGEIITAFLNEHAIDEMIISVVPIILGKGIRLFAHQPAETHFELVSSTAFDTGVVNLEYCKTA
ncbi:MAG TPA: dihydrofolate reductase family protein [Bacteroidales bacterium]|nr:dihydrofolate reductase family protein [Bacteroidales bacterium]